LRKETEDEIKRLLLESKSREWPTNKNFMDHIFGNLYKKESNEFDDGFITINGEIIRVEVKEQKCAQWLDVRKYAKGIVENKDIHDAIFIYYESTGKITKVIVVDMKRWTLNFFKDKQDWLQDPKFWLYTDIFNQTKSSFNDTDILDHDKNFRGCVKMTWPFPKERYKNGIE
jgi:hypothetical protein